MGKCLSGSVPADPHAVPQVEVATRLGISIKIVEKLRASQPVAIKFFLSYPGCDLHHIASQPCCFTPNSVAVGLNERGTLVSTVNESIDRGADDTWRYPAQSVGSSRRHWR